MTARALRFRRGQVHAPVLSPRSLKENMLALASAQVVTWGLTGLTLALLARYFGPHTFGQISVALTFSSLAFSFSTLGLPTLITRSIARDGLEARDDVAAALCVSVLMGFAAATLLALSLPLWGYSGTGQVLIVIALIGVPLGLVQVIGFAIFQGLQVMRYQAVIDIANKFLGLVAIVLVLLLGGGAIAYSVIGLALAACIALPFMAFALRSMHVTHVRPANFRHAWEIARAGLPMYSIEVALVLYLSVDVLMLSLLADEHAVGLYSAPIRLFATMLFIPNVMATAVFPRLSGSFHNDVDDFVNLSTKALLFVAVMTVPIAVGLVMTSGLASNVLFGEEYRDSGVVIAALAVSIVPTSLNVFIARAFIAADRQRRWSVIMGVALVSKVAVAAVLIPLFDHKFGNPALGAAVGLSLVEFSMTAAGLAFAPRVLQRRLVEPMARRVGFCALVGLATLVLLSPVSLLVASLAAAVVYAVCATLTGLTRHYLAVVLAQAGPLLTRRVATNEV